MHVAERLLCPHLTSDDYVFIKLKKQYIYFSVSTRHIHQALFNVFGRHL